MTGASTIAGSMRATDFSSDEKGFQGICILLFMLCEFPSAHFESKDDARSQRFSQGESDLHKDITQNPDDDHSMSSWEKSLNQETSKASDRSEGWGSSADSVVTFVRHKSCHMIILFSPRGTYQTGLFAVVVVTFLPLSFTVLQPSPGVYDTDFRPPRYAVLVNAVWLTSLALSMACALLATLVQQWARNFKEAADKKDSDLMLSQRVRIYAFFLVGVERFALPVAVDVIPVLLHSSVLLFFGGLAVFLLNVNHTLGYMMSAMVVSGFLIYIFLTIMPLFIPNSPYQTPLSPFWWYTIQLTSYFGLCLFQWLPIYSLPNSIYKHGNKIWKGMSSALESKAIQSTTPEKPHGDLEEFLEWLHRLFYHSAWFKRQYSVQLRQGLEHLVTPVADKLFTISPPLEGPPTEDTKPSRKRLDTCLKAIWCFSGTVDRHFQAIWKQFKLYDSDNKTNEHEPWGPLSAETWNRALEASTHSDAFIALRSQCIQALMAVMWKEELWQCVSHDPEDFLQRQLGASPVSTKWSDISRNQLQFAVAANLLSKSLPLLRELEIGAHKTLRMEIKAILDRICPKHTSDLPDELRARFVDRAIVQKVFASIHPHEPERELSGPWAIIFETRTSVRASV